MEGISRSILKVVQSWSARTLEDLRCDAVLEDTGIAYTAMRAPNGKRICMAMCVTGDDQIRRLREAIDLVDDGVHEDWCTLSLGEMLMRSSVMPNALAFEPLRGSGDEWLAFALIAAVPDSVRMLEVFFDLPS